MRIDPVIISEEKKAADQQKTDRVTRKVALAFAFITVFIFFFKLLFF